MWCLWNGEYGEHDIINYEQSLKTQEQFYKNYVGIVLGDYTVVKVEYDWGVRKQRWTLKCNLCGKEIYKYDKKNIMRGHGRSRLCDCHYESKKQKEIRLKEEKKLEEEKRKQEEEKREKELLNSTHGDWKIIEFKSPSECKVKCIICGKEKGAKVKEVLDLTAPVCHHPKDYSGPEWIGKRNGNLTAIGRDGAMFVARCDCGKEINVRPVELFTRKTKRSCGGPECQYSSVLHKEAIKRKSAGFAYEQKVAKYLSGLGHNITLTKNSGDFGVDIIISEPNGELTAIQCKMDFAPTGVSSVQEIYAGGRYYDCTRFVVFCEQGFSSPAITMAKKLGVYLCEGKYEYPDDLNKYTTELLPVFHPNHGNRKLYEAYGQKRTLSDWCAALNIAETELKGWMKKGVTFERALAETAIDASHGTSRIKPPRKTYTVRGFTGNLSQICEHFGTSSQKVNYRMKHMNMTLEEAIFTPNTSEKRVN